MNSSFRKAGFRSSPLFQLEGITILPSTPSAGCGNLSQLHHWFEQQVPAVFPGTAVARLLAVLCHILELLGCAAGEVSAEGVLGVRVQFVMMEGLLYLYVVCNGAIDLQ